MCMTSDELTATVRDLKQMRTLEKKITEKIKTLEEAIKLHMSDTDTYTYSTDEYSVSWYEVSSSRIDTAAIKRDLPDIAAQYTNTTTTRRFILS